MLILVGRASNWIRKTIISFIRHTTCSNINSSTSFSDWHQQIYFSELTTFLCNRDNIFILKSCQVIPLTHFAKSQRCQAYLMPSITWLLQHWHTQAWFWQANAYPTYYSLGPQHGWTVESDLGGSWMATQDIVSRVVVNKKILELEM